MIKKWWHNKIAYQIYPKSFLDTNSDGIGDIKGIISKLDYLKDLGIDIIWTSPMYKSPFKDQGYDISDYYAIDPSFGTMEDMEELIKEAKKRDMHIIFDLVINHCSSEHEWFKKALADPDSEYADYFYFVESKDGIPPNNWRTYFGGSAWEKVPNSNKYYLHLYAKEQPDLNFENPVVREKIYEMINWWLEKGISGYRVDAIINIKKDLSFKNYEPDRDDGMVSPQIMVENAVGVIDVLRDISNNTFKKYDAFTAAELFNYNPKQLEDFIGKDGVFSTIFDFSTDLLGQSYEGWHKRRKPTANEYRDTILNGQILTKDIGILSNIYENHDEPRGVCRYLEETTEMGKKMLATELFMIKGVPFIYQGQEIGMENNKFETIDDVDDINSRYEYEFALTQGLDEKSALNIIDNFSRDNARTPMQWTNGENAGFTDGTPWLKVNKNHDRINVESQINDENSLFNYYKKLISVRKNEKYQDVITYGDILPVHQEIDNIMAFYRVNDDKKLLTICNHQNVSKELDFNDEISHTILNNYENVEVNNGKISLEPYQAIVLQVK